MQLIEGSPISEWESWACARQLLAVHGNDARYHAAERLDAMAVAGDPLGYLTWSNITLCLIALSVPLPLEICH